MSTITFQNTNTGEVWDNINPNTILRAIVVIGSLTVLLACNLLQSPEMEFNVNSNLLGLHEHNPALKISYQVPVGFVKVSEVNFLERHQNIPIQHEKNISISAVYKDTTTGSFMILSKVNEEQWEQYDNFIDNTAASPLALEWNYVNATKYKYNKFDVQQWLLQDIEWVNFRLLFNKNTSFFQVDYLIPTMKYNREIGKFIESSIGSFTSN